MSSQPFRPELLSPAGSLKNMRYAFAYGADAVYAGQPRYSLRVRNNEFDHANLAQGIREARVLGKRFYVVVSIAPHVVGRRLSWVSLRSTAGYEPANNPVARVSRRRNPGRSVPRANVPASAAASFSAVAAVP